MSNFWHWQTNFLEVIIANYLHVISFQKMHTISSLVQFFTKSHFPRNCALCSLYYKTDLTSCSWCLLPQIIANCEVWVYFDLLTFDVLSKKISTFLGGTKFYIPLNELFGAVLYYDGCGRAFKFMALFEWAC